MRHLMPTSTEFLSSIPVTIISTPRSGKEEVDMYRFIRRSNHSSDQYVLFCHDPLSRLAIDASLCMKLARRPVIRTYTNALVLFAEIR